MGDIIYRCVFLLLSAIACFTSAASAAEAPRPNIVFIIADDMGYADVSFHGSEIKTPNIDSIASAGAKLEQFYVQPVCSPTRAAFMTGRYPMRYGLQVGVVRPWAQYGVPLEERMLPAALKEAGYETAITGKWHIGHFEPEYLPTRRGFDHQYGHYNGALDYFTHDRDGGLDWHRDDKALREEGYSTFLLADEAAKRIRQRDQSKPLFLYVPFNAVHTPLQVPDEYKKPYQHLDEPRRTVAGMLAAMDEGIGRILAALDEAKMRDNTLIVFCSDNGGFNPGRATNNGPLRAGKGTVYEGGVRVAACAAWPGKIPPGSAVQQPIHIVDMFPTLLTLAGGKLEQPLPIDGKDAWATISQGAPSPHDAILLNTTPWNGAIRMGDWKLVLNGQRPDGDGPADAEAQETERRPRRRETTAGSAPANTAPPHTVELFNLASDIGEKKNVAAEHPEKLKELRARYDAFAAEAVPFKSRPKPAEFVSPKVWGEIEVSKRD
jgi:arylsulfatase A-like enzyme